MAISSGNEPMLDIYIFETSQLLEKLEKIILSGEKSASFTADEVNEIFRIMHTIKGSSAMMLFNSISITAHSIEDLFYFIREEKTVDIDFKDLSDLLLDCVDFVKVELEKVKNGDDTDGNSSLIIERIKDFLNLLKGNEADNITDSDSMKDQENKKKQQYFISPKKSPSSVQFNIYEAVIYFEDGCGMESIRAFTVVNNLKSIASDITFVPRDIIDNDSGDEVIQNEGFRIYIKTEHYFDDLNKLLKNTPLLKELRLSQLEDEHEYSQFFKRDKLTIEEQSVKVPKIGNGKDNVNESEKEAQAEHQQGFIIVSVDKLDKLMNLIGELVISEAMVTQNPDIKGLKLNNFSKSARHLKKVTGELQDIVMSVRMVPLASTFQKMNRVVRDMCKKIDKEVRLEIIGEETEVDKNIIEHISDPLMHLIRNSIDHGIETWEEREKSGKQGTGTIILEAKNAGNDVLIIVRDDGKGLDKEKILEKARKNNLIHKPESELTDKEIYSFVFTPGFSTKDSVTEYSGRGVGMDVVVKNVESVGGTVSIDSTPCLGTAITIKIPLTLAIIDGMIVKVGSSSYTIPTISIRESFRAKEKDIITDPDGREMVMVRGKCYSIVRLHELFKINTGVTSLTNGIIIMVESEKNIFCIFADRLVGQQQVVVKALPVYLRNMRNIKDISGCTILGDGSIGLIIDVEGLLGK